MIKQIKKQIEILSRLVVIAFALLLLVKLILIGGTYSYAFLQMNGFQAFYYFFTLVQSDFLILGMGLLLVWVISKQHYPALKRLFGLGILSLFALYVGDLLVIYFFQQRLSFATGETFYSAGTNIVMFYLTVFVLCFWAFIFLTLLIARFLKLTINEKRFFALCVGSFLWYGIPFPQFHFLGVELPEKNILDKVARTSYELSLNSQELPTDTPIVLKKLPLTEQELQLLKKRKEFWIELAREHPEKIFQTFQHSSLKKATDEYGQDYVFEILAEATKANPELAFTSLNQYKDWKDSQGKGIVKSILKIAIEHNPELAFRYLEAYQNLVENNEKIAKSLLQFALQHYRDPLTFDQLFHQVEGRNNQKNLILVFLESASSVDSQKFWGLNNRLPLIDAISDDGVAFTELHANGTSSDMGHIATLIGMEPITFDYTGTRYQNYIGYVQPLGHFFNNLGYATTFLSTASLDFLDQKSFLNYAGYQKLIGREAFKDRPRYTFDAAPDGDLYAKTIEVIKSQTSPYFLTLQTISSHTPYNTPYGKTMEDMYRYEDESFAKFYTDLKATDFFKNGILIVIGDHRKMTPLEDEEFAKRGTTAGAKIIGFMIGKDIPKNQIDNGLYQQTDIFYSLIREFGKGKVEVLNNYNDFFTKTISRNRAVKHRYDQKKVNIADNEGHYGYVDLRRMKIIDGSDYFPVEEVLNYLKLSLKFQQKEKTDPNTTLSQNETVLIAHRGVTTNASENSLNAFKAARDAGAQGLELDITTTKDGKLIVYHGPSVANLTQCKKEQRTVCQMTREELQACKLNDGQKIQTFEDILPQIKNRFSFIFVDFKVADHPLCRENKQENLENAIQLVQKNKMDAKVVFSSYDKDLMHFLAKKGDIGSALDTYSLKDLDQLSWSYFSYFMTPAENFSTTLIGNLNKESVEPVAYVINDPQAFKKLKTMGVRFVMTDEIEKLKKEHSN